MKSFALDTVWAKSARVALTIALMAGSCALELETSANSQPHAVKQLRRGYQSSRLIVRGEPQRSLTYIAGTRVLKRKEERRETTPDPSNFCKAFSQCNARTESTERFALLIIRPDRLVELSSTPPPEVLV